jgi:hypothetical protein
MTRISPLRSATAVAFLKPEHDLFRKPVPTFRDHALGPVDIHGTGDSRRERKLIQG